MIRRSINARFEQPVLEGRKTTTIRDKPWPVGVPIQLFRWEGKAYRSKQINVAVIEVRSVSHMDISESAYPPHLKYDFAAAMVSSPKLWETEGFTSKEDMDDWFRPLVKPGQTLHQHLMHFRVI